MPKNIDALIQGYRRFRKQYFEQNDGTYEKLVKFGQSPKVLIIACSDSRVDPALITNCDPGDIFVVRNVANLVPPIMKQDQPLGTIAALEFAVCGLNIHHIVVLGHSQCGGIDALMKNDPQTLTKLHYVADWMKIAEPARNCTLSHQYEAAEQTDHCARFSIINSLSNLKTFPWVKERMEKGELFIHGWFFNLSNGVIYQYDSSDDDFKALEAN